MGRESGQKSPNRKRFPLDFELLGVFFRAMHGRAAFLRQDS